VIDTLRPALVAWAGQNLVGLAVFVTKRELGEALERQAATDEVLRVISSSPGELGPVFEATLHYVRRIQERARTRARV
jgi:hypothetical protein